MDKAKVVLDKDFKISKVDDKVFSSFVEPIGRCIYGGIYEPGHPMADENGFRKDVLEKTKALNLTLNRFPGGNYTSTYRWEDSIGPKANRPKRVEVAWQCIETNQFGIDEFADWSKLNGSDVMMTVNLATRGVLEAMDCVEYCNFKGGTYWSDKRIEYGHKEPHNYKYWCLTNEIDGVWQVGQKNPTDYGRIAREAAKGMKLIDHDIKTVLAGSSSPGQDTFPWFDMHALQESYDFVDYLSIHQYITNAKDDTPSFVARNIVTDNYFKSAIAACDYVKAVKNSNKKINISFDEYNVWHTITKRPEERFEVLWPEVKTLIEDRYTAEDAVALGGMLISILRHADRVEIACISELVNCISHLRTRDGGGCWALPPYYTFLLFSKYGRGTALHTAIDSPKYDCTAFTDVPYLDAMGVLGDDDSVTLFAINRSVDEDLPLELELRGFGEYRVDEHIVLTDADPKATNTEEDPEHVVPKANGNAAVEDGKVKATLPKLSWNVIRLVK
jgi:alpha-N-arabinofuranosidase